MQWLASLIISCRARDTLAICRDTLASRHRPVSTRRCRWRQREPILGPVRHVNYRKESGMPARVVSIALVLASVRLLAQQPPAACPATDQSIRDADHAVWRAFRERDDKA